MANTQKITLITEYVIAIVEFSSSRLKVSNANVENVESPPQKPQVIASFRLGWIDILVWNNVKQIPKIKLATILTKSVGNGSW